MGVPVCPLRSSDWLPSNGGHAPAPTTFPTTWTDPDMTDQFGMPAGLLTLSNSWLPEGSGMTGDSKPPFVRTSIPTRSDPRRNEFKSPLLPDNLKPYVSPATTSTLTEPV